MKKIVLIVMIMATTIANAQLMGSCRYKQCGPRNVPKFKLSVTSQRALREKKREAALDRQVWEDFVKEFPPAKYSRMSPEQQKAWMDERKKWYKGDWKKTYSEEAAARHEDRRRMESQTSNVGWYCPSNIASATTPSPVKLVCPSRKPTKNVNVMDELPPDVRAFFDNATDIHIR